jgi:hypothetical protein
MKYTEYLLKEDFIDLNGLVSKRRYLKEVTAILPCVIAMAGVVVISTMLPVTLTVDTINKLRK